VYFICVASPDNIITSETFHAVPLWLQNYFHVKPMYVAILLALGIAGGIAANAILDFVYLGRGDNIVGS